MGMVEIFRDAGIGGWLQVALLALGLLWSLVCAGMLGMRWKVPAVVATAPLIAHALAAVLGTALSGASAQELAAVDPAQRATLMAMGIAGTINNGVLTLAVVPSALVLGLGGLAGSLRGPKKWGVPVGAILVCGLVALVPLGGVLAGGDVALAAMRFALYGACAIPVGLALAGAHPRSNGREAGMVAAVAYLSFVAAAEIAAGEHGWSRSFAALAGADPAGRKAFVAAVLDQMSGQGTLGWLTFGLASLPAVMALVKPDVELTEEEVMEGSVSPSPMRSLGTVFALAALPAWAVAMLSCNPASLIEAVAH